MTKKNLKKKRDGEILAKKKRGKRKKKFESGAVDNAGFNMQAKKKNGKIKAQEIGRQNLHTKANVRCRKKKFKYKKKK